MNTLKWSIVESTMYRVEMWYCCATGLVSSDCCPFAIRFVGSVYNNNSSCTKFLHNIFGRTKKGRDYDSI